MKMNYETKKHTPLRVSFHHSIIKPGEIWVWLSVKNVRVTPLICGGLG